MKTLNSLEYYKKLNYDIKIRRISDEDQRFIAFVDELGEKSCYGIGESANEAIDNFMAEKNKFIEYLYEEGIIIPEPLSSSDYSDYSGTLTFRTSPYLHCSLSKAADKNKLSLNQFLNQRLSQSNALDDIKEVIKNSFTNLENLLLTHDRKISRQVTNYNIVDTEKPKLELFGEKKVIDHVTSDFTEFRKVVNQ